MSTIKGTIEEKLEQIEEIVRATCDGLLLTELTAQEREWVAKDVGVLNFGDAPYVMQRAWSLHVHRNRPTDITVIE